MHIQPMILESPQWPGEDGRRLRISLLLSTICVLTILTILRFPVVERTGGSVTELLVRIIWEETELIELLPESPFDAEPATHTETHLPLPKPTERNRDAATKSHDWYARIPVAAKEALDNVPPAYSVNPVFDEKRRQAAQQFYPSRARAERPIWENVEKDPQGRSVLWSGDCYRVIDDPNAGSREAFETFGQYITMCMNWQDSPKELPWVSEFRNRRANPARYALPTAE